MPKLKFALLALAVAALGGLAAGHFYAELALPAAQAEAPLPTPPYVTPPKWEDLHVVYLGPADGRTPSMAPDFLATTYAYAATDFADVQAYSAQHGLDMLIFDEYALGQIDPNWAKAQFRLGTAFVGLNVTGPELGTLLDDPTFANEEAQLKAGRLPEPFYSMTMYRVSGPADEIQRLEEHNALYPYNLDMQIKLDVYNVAMQGARGYIQVVQGMQFELDSLKLAFRGLQPVQPYNP